MVRRPADCGPQVVPFPLQPVQPRTLLGTEELRLGLLHEAGEELAMAKRDDGGVRSRREPLATVFPDRLEHPEPGLAGRGFVDPQQALVDERRQALEEVEPELRAGSHTAVADFRLEPADEDRDPREERLLDRVEEVVAPVDRAAQRLLAGRQVARPAGQDREALPQPREEGLRREQLDPGGCQLDREREPIEARAQLGHRGRVLVRHREVVARSSGTLDEERDGVVLGEVLRGGQVPRVRHRERRHGVLVLAPDVENLAAAGENRQARCRGEQLAHERRAGDDLLEVVEHEEDLTVAQVVLERVEHGPVRLLAKADRLGDRARQQRRVGDRRQLDEEHAVRVRSPERRPPPAG